MTTVAANAMTILSGPIVFGDPVPDDALGFTARILAFVLVLGAAALTPAPIRGRRGVANPMISVRSRIGAKSWTRPPEGLSPSC